MSTALAASWLRRVPAELAAGAGLLLALALLALLVPAATRDPAEIDLYARFAPPLAPGHLLGADHLGRDLLARAAAGTQWSLAVAAGATVLAAALGTLLGLWAAASRGVGRRVLLQVVNLILSFPSLIAAMALIAIVGQGYATLVLVLGTITSPVFARVVYAESLALLERDYVAAARTFGVSRARMFARHVLPGLRPSLLAVGAFHFADMLVAETALSFLGVGAPIDTATWGNMLSDARSYLFQAPWMLLVPAGAMIAAVLCATLLGDGLSRRLRAREWTR
ncbi:MAG: ABC transporter permease [Steroidobacteraceae bacterium]|nr:ABC transporter permease [Steroidobacteraceae bacterium]